MVIDSIRQAPHIVRSCDFRRRENKTANKCCVRVDGGSAAFCRAYAVGACHGRSRSFTSPVVERHFCALWSPIGILCAPENAAMPRKQFKYKSHQDCN